VSYPEVRNGKKTGRWMAQIKEPPDALRFREMPRQRAPGAVWVLRVDLAFRDAVLP
jgi:hypothetical protein